VRQVLHGDVVAAARVLCVVPEAARPALLERLLDEAHWADLYRKRTGRAHPVWGDGTLMTAALRRDPPPEPTLSDRRYCGCLVQVLHAVLERRSRG
jgi:hypothetical protein